MRKANLKKPRKSLLCAVIDVMLNDSLVLESKVSYVLDRNDDLLTSLSYLEQCI